MHYFSWRRTSTNADQAIQLDGEQTLTYQEFRRRWERDGYEGLSDFEREVAALDMLHGDLLNGGLARYFLSASGDRCPDALAALASLGVDSVHDALESAVDDLWPGGYPTDREKRIERSREPDGPVARMLDQQTRTIQGQPENYLGSALDRLQQLYSDEANSQPVNPIGVFFAVFTGFLGGPVGRERTTRIAGWIVSAVLVVLAIVLIAVFGRGAGF